MSEGWFGLLGVLLGGCVASAVAVWQTTYVRRGEWAGKLAALQLETAITLQGLLVRLRAAALGMESRRLPPLLQEATDADLREYMAIDGDIHLLVTRLLNYEVRAAVEQFRGAYFHATIDHHRNTKERVMGQHSYELPASAPILDLLGLVIQVAGANSNDVPIREQLRVLGSDREGLEHAAARLNGLTPSRRLPSPWQDEGDE